jgi:hypothetical protein
MSNDEKRASPKRRYPGLYDKAIPIALGIIVLAVVVLLVVIFGVALGLFPGV